MCKQFHFFSMAWLNLNDENLWGPPHPPTKKKKNNQFQSQKVTYGNVNNIQWTPLVVNSRGPFFSCKISEIDFIRQLEWKLSKKLVLCSSHPKDTHLYCTLSGISDVRSPSQYVARLYAMACMYHTHTFACSVLLLCLSLVKWCGHFFFFFYITVFV